MLSIHLQTANNLLSKDRDVPVKAYFQLDSIYGTAVINCTTYMALLCVSAAETTRLAVLYISNLKQLPLGYPNRVSSLEEPSAVLRPCDVLQTVGSVTCAALSFSLLCQS